MERIELPSKSDIKPGRFNFLLQAIRYTSVQYVTISAICGLRYLNEKNGNICTKALWLVIVVLSFAFASFLLSVFVLRYLSNPTRIVIETNHMPIGHSEFPAISFCPINQMSSAKALMLSQSLKLPKNVSEPRFAESLMQSLGFLFDIEYDVNNLQMLEATLQVNNKLAPANVMSALIQSCDELMVKCRWLGTIVDCMKIFRATKTYFGTCCTFNIDQSNGSTNLFGYLSGLTVAIAPILDYRTYTSTYSRSIRAIIHERSAYPSYMSIVKIIEIGSESFIKLTAMRTYCSDAIRQMAQSARDCNFENEQKLRFFSKYSELNCYADCMFRNVLETCNCLPYHYATVPDVKVCNFTQIPCLVDHYDDVHLNLTKDMHKCACPQNCEVTQYDVATSKQRILPMHNITTVDTFYQHLDANHAVVHLYQGSQVYRLKRRGLQADILYVSSNFGGIYGLCLGMTILSMVEIFYYAFVRLRVNYTKIQVQYNAARLYSKR